MSKMDLQPIPPYQALGHYVPYFYQRGLYHWYPLPGKKAYRGGLSQPQNEYDFTSDLLTPSVFRPGQTVEDLIQHGYLSVPKSDPTLALITDRKFTSGMGLEDLLSQIHRRYQIYQQNMYEVEISKCEAVNAIHRIEADRGGPPATSQEQYGMNKRIQDLYEQQRDERINLWRDVSRLRLSISEVAGQYLSAYRKVNLLQDLQGEP